MERYFLLDKFNTFYDWRLIVTGKSITPPEPKTMYVEIDGMSGSLDLSEALSGEVTYKDRELTARFWTDRGTRKEREKLLREIRLAIHGKKIKIVEPDDPDHYFLGRVQIKAEVNNLAFAEFEIVAICEPWRYCINDSFRRVDLDNNEINVVIKNSGAKTICPEIKVTDDVTITYDNIETLLTPGTYLIPTLKLYHGFNVIKLSGNGVVSFSYKEADL